MSHPDYGGLVKGIEPNQRQWIFRGQQSWDTFKINLVMIMTLMASAMINHYNRLTMAMYKLQVLVFWTSKLRPRIYYGNVWCMIHIFTLTMEWAIWHFIADHGDIIYIRIWLTPFKLLRKFGCFQYDEHLIKCIFHLKFLSFQKNLSQLVFLMNVIIWL